MKPSNSYVLNLFGTCLQIWELHLTEELKARFQAYISQKNSTWYDVLFDLSLLQQFDLNHWTQVANKVGSAQMLLNADSRIELRKNGRIAERINIQELLSPQGFFGQYDTHNLDPIQLNKDKIHVIEQLKGQVAKYTFELERFQMDKLQFGLRSDDLSKETRLGELTYNSNVLKNKYEDLLLMGQEVRPCCR
jgi:hypothetical protein